MPLSNRSDRFGGRAPSCALAAAFFVFAAPVAVAQDRAYCNITGIESVRLVNAVQLTIRADGLMVPDIDSSDLFNTAAARAGEWDKMGKRVTEIPIGVRNARSQVGSISNVGIYPVSHVEVTVPPGSREGIGVDVRVVLYQPAMTREVRLAGDRWNFDPPNEQPPFISIEQSQDRRSIVVIITSDRRTPAPEQRRKPADPDKRTLEVKAENGFVTVYALDADLRDLVRDLSRATGVNVTVAADLERTVSLSLDSVKLEEALECIAMTYGASLDAVGASIYLADGGVGDLSAYHGSDFADIPLRHIGPLAARNSLPDVLLGYVHADVGRNALTVAGPRALVEKVRRDVAVLDVPPPMVEIIASAVEFGEGSDLSAIVEGGLRWPGGSLDIGVTSGDIAYSSLGIGESDLHASLRALVQKGRARLRSETRATALNGRTARLFVGKEQRLATQYFDFWSDNFETRILTLSVGTSLDVTPRAAGGGYVTAEIRAEVSNITETERGTGNPTIAQRVTEATVRLTEGETLFIGGLDIAESTDALRSLFLGAGSYPPTRSRSSSRLGVFVTARSGTRSAGVPPATANGHGG
ncbi:MAG: hypothetical protein FJX72_04450 [Armatimonadetes bacterium]|nr:hypothetical protein [Armatimonadota bacterium]